MRGIWAGWEEKGERGGLECADSEADGDVEENVAKFILDYISASVWDAKA